MLVLLLLTACGGGGAAVPANEPARPARAPTDPPTDLECRMALSNAYRLSPADLRARLPEQDYVATFLEQCLGQATLAWTECVTGAASEADVSACGCQVEPTHCRK